jgi:CRISPR/Cas system-associated protein Cas10 (large subunit of type III CRISPR-Cas system)
MGERVGINLRHIGYDDDGEHECSKCGMKKATSGNGCCHDEEVVIKRVQEALSMMPYIQVSIDIADLTCANFNIPPNDRLLYVKEKSTLFQSHGPPGYAGPPLFLRNCVFLI